MVSSRSRSMLNSYYFSESHVDPRDTILVRASYDEGSVVRPTPRIDTITLPAWHRVEPSLGDKVICIYGTGRVIEIRPSRQQIAIRLSSWELADTSMVTCYLAASAVKVIAGPQKVEDMSVEDRIKYAQFIKEQAEQAFSAQNYKAALQIYESVFDDFQYDIQGSPSSSKVKADLVLLMITCSNNAATCCSQLERWSDSERFARHALLLIETLENKRGKRVHTFLNKAGFTDSKLLGEWRVKAYLAVAKASLEKQCMDEARNILFKVRDVVAIYTGEEYTKQPQAEESVKNLQAFDKQAKKLQRSIEKVRKSPRNQSTTETKKKTRVFGARNAGNSNNSSGSSNSKPQKAVLGKSFLASTTKTAAPLAKKQPKGILASANHGLENHVTERLEI